MRSKNPFGRIKEFRRTKSMIPNDSVLRAAGPPDLARGVTGRP
jgi:hypothetical protein